jgi:hypothetical protein
MVVLNREHCTQLGVHQGQDEHAGGADDPYTVTGLWLLLSH